VYYLYLLLLVEGEYSLQPSRELAQLALQLADPHKGLLQVLLLFGELPSLPLL